MPVLSKMELVALNPDKIYKLPFLLHFELWPNLDASLLSNLVNPVKLPFDEDIRANLGALKDRKGIYFFFVESECPFVPSVNYFVYVGRVTEDNTFFKRFYDYVTAIGNKNKRRNIQLLTNLWPGKTWVYFFDLNLTDSEIDAIESNIYDNVVPPLNNKFKAKRAQNSRSIYN